MKKLWDLTKSYRRMAIVLGTGLAFCMASILLSCENFMDGAELKQQLENQIEYASETPFTVNVILADPLHGQVNVTSKTLKKDDEFELVFTEAVGFAFEKWTCTDSSAIKILSPENPTTKILAIKSGSLIQGSPIITPVCTEKFVVKSVLPENKDGGVARDSTILINFSDSLDESTFAEMIQGKIKITDANGASLSDYYEEAVLVNDGMTLKFSSKREKPVITSGTAMVYINIESGIKNSKGDALEPFEGYKFKLNSTHDSDAPLFVDFYVSKTLEGLGLESGQIQNLIGEASAYEESEDFHIKDFVWVYCKAEDKGSGAYYLTANGKIIPLTYANSTTDKKQNFVLTAENIYEIGPFKLEFDSDKYEDGKIDVEFALYDYCDNECPDTKNYSFIKDTQIEQPYVYLYNEFADIETWFYKSMTFWGQYTGGTDQYYQAGINGARPYYSEENFNSYYKKIFIKGLQNDEWSGQSYKITGKNDVSVYYTVNGTEYKAEYSEEDSDDYASCFIMDKFSENEDTYVRAVIQDSVGNSKEVTTYIPAGGISVNYGVSSYGSISPVASKSTLNSADSVEFMYFYEFTWTEKEEEFFKNQDSVTSALSTMNGYSDQSWYNEISADEYNENAARRLLNICHIEENKKYIADFYTALNLGPSAGTIYGYGPGLQSNNCFITRISFFANDTSDNNIDSYLYLSELYQKNVPSITCYAVPRYKYSDNGTHYIYGKPIKSQVILYSGSYSTDYTLDFEISDVTSMGKNTGKAQATIKNVSIKDSENNDRLSDFDVKYFYTTSTGTTYTFDEPHLTFDSAYSVEWDYTAGVIAVLKSDNSIVVNESKPLTIPVIDNYAPEPNEYWAYAYSTYNLFDYDKTGKNYFIDLQWYCCAYTNYKKTYSNINYLFKDKGSSALREATGSYDFEYYWIPYDATSMQYELPTLKVDSDGNELFSYIRKASSKFDWIYPLAEERNTGYKMWVPVYDLEDGHYVLAIKLTDTNGNYLLKAVTYHDVETYKNLPEVTLSGTTLTIKQTFGNQLTPSERNYWSSYRKTTIAGIQYFDNSSGWQEINLNYYLTTGNYANYKSDSINVAAAEGKFVKCGVQSYQADYTATDQEREGRYSSGDYASKSLAIDIFNGDINSYPVYKYVGSDTGSYHNLLDANGGITVFCDAPAFVHTLYSIREEGYGNDINEWERRAREVSPVQISVTSNYNGYQNVPEDAKSYVVIAYFADGTSAISNVHKK
ncbi:MAG: hypothetical protein IJ630_08985 [Treponema sp.]|nr:hypothetical protein [Treponema sp.]